MTDTYRYYCPHPPVPGAIARGAHNVVSYKCKRFVPGVRVPVWGYAEYPIPLEEGVAEKYGMVRAEGKEHER